MSNEFIPLVVVRDGAEQEIELSKLTPKAKFIPSDTIKEIFKTDFGSSLRVVERGGIKKEVEVLETPLQVEAAKDPGSTNVYVQAEIELSADAAGSTQGAGTPITKHLTEIDTATDGSAEAVVLPAKATGAVYKIINNTGVALEVFPAVGENIDNLADDAQFDLPANTTVAFACLDAANEGWRSVTF